MVALLWESEAEDDDDDDDDDTAAAAPAAAAAAAAELGESLRGRPRLRLGGVVGAVGSWLEYSGI